MRARVVFLVAAILLVAAFSALNWSEIIRPVPLTLGARVVEAPLGLILLGVMTLLTMAFMLDAAVVESRHLLDEREFHRELKAQRELADKAEGSRFVELRQHIDAQLAEGRERDAAVTTALDRMLVSSHHDLQSKMQAINDTMARRLAEVDAKLADLRERTKTQVEVV